jgi:hypothetical protein
MGRLGVAHETLDGILPLSRPGRFLPWATRFFLQWRDFCERTHSLQFELRVRAERRIETTGKFRVQLAQLFIDARARTLMCRALICLLFAHCPTSVNSNEK